MSLLEIKCPVCGSTDLELEDTTYPERGRMTDHAVCNECCSHIEFRSEVKVTEVVVTS